MKKSYDFTGALIFTLPDDRTLHSVTHHQADNITNGERLPTGGRVALEQCAPTELTRNAETSVQPWMTNTTRPSLNLLYLATTLLLLVQQIDSAHWHEWRLFGIPGGIQVFLGADIVIIAPFLYGLLRLQKTPRLGAQLGLALEEPGRAG
jgi:hypothetical protein